eukprot:Skav233125  [mRNA]  locus=scaffold792:32914:34344:- [translate_table: standard]
MCTLPSSQPAASLSPLELQASDVSQFPKSTTRSGVRVVKDRRQSFPSEPPTARVCWHQASERTGELWL